MKALQAVVLGLGIVASGALAQATDGTSASKLPAEAKKAPGDAKKAPADAKKAPAPKRAVPAKKPEAAKKPEPKKAEPPKSTDPNVRYFRPGDKDAPKLRDRDGNVIPSNPDAYDVSSALKK